MKLVLVQQLFLKIKCMYIKVDNLILSFSSSKIIQPFYQLIVFIKTCFKNKIN